MNKQLSCSKIILISAFSKDRKPPTATIRQRLDLHAGDRTESAHPPGAHAREAGEHPDAARDAHTTRPAMETPEGNPKNEEETAEERQGSEEKEAATRVARWRVRLLRARQSRPRRPPLHSSLLRRGGTCIDRCALGERREARPAPRRDSPRGDSASRTASF